MSKHKKMIEILEARIKAQHGEIDALSRCPDNNRMVNYLLVATERRKETAAILIECISIT